MKHLQFSQHPRKGNVIEYTATPRFSACWTSGDRYLPYAMGEHWMDASSGDGVDSLHIFNIEWQDAPPTDRQFDAIMRLVSRAINAWIVERF